MGSSSQGQDNNPNADAARTRKKRVEYEASQSAIKELEARKKPKFGSITGSKIADALAPGASLVAAGRAVSNIMLDKQISGLKNNTSNPVRTLVNRGTSKARYMTVGTVSTNDLGMRSYTGRASYNPIGDGNLGNTDSSGYYTVSKSTNNSNRNDDVAPTTSTPSSEPAVTPETIKTDKVASAARRASSLAGAASATQRRLLGKV